MPKFNVPCEWAMSGHYVLEAKDYEEAFERALALPLPKEQIFYDDSFHIDLEKISEVPDDTPLSQIQGKQEQNRYYTDYEAAWLVMDQEDRGDDPFPNRTW